MATEQTFINLKKVMAAIRSAPARRFEMNAFISYYGGTPRCTIGDLVHRCDTAGCIAGWAIMVLANPLRPAPSYGGVRSGAQRLLGLTETEHQYLVMGGWSRNGIRATRAEALQYLQKAIAEKNVMVSI